MARARSAKVVVGPQRSNVFPTAWDWPRERTTESATDETETGQRVTCFPPGMGRKPPDSQESGG